MDRLHHGGIFFDWDNYNEFDQLLHHLVVVISRNL